jgi:CTP synthase
MVIDYARNICGLSEANSLEFDESTKFPVVGFLPGQFAAMAK